MHWQSGTGKTDSGFGLLCSLYLLPEWSNAFTHSVEQARKREVKEELFDSQALNGFASYQNLQPVHSKTQGSFSRFVDLFERFQGAIQGLSSPSLAGTTSCQS